MTTIRPWMRRPAIDGDFIKANKQRTMLQALAEVITEKGYTGAKVADIVKRAGVARKTFYDNFRGKEDAFREMMVEVVRATYAAAEAGMPLEALGDRAALVEAFLISGPVLAESYYAALDELAPLTELPEPRARYLVGCIEWRLRRAILHGESLASPALHTELRELAMLMEQDPTEENA